MLRMFLLLLAGFTAMAADDPWTKVRDLKSGDEVRVYKRGASRPVIGKVDEATDENLIVVIKNEQSAIPKDQIDRIDMRPVQTKSRMTTQTKTTTEDPSHKPPLPGPSSAVPTTSTSSNVSFGGKPDFETIYRRTASVPAKPQP
jgi:hypothetical protein